MATTSYPVLVDAQLSTSSGNAVQNAVVTTALNSKANSSALLDVLYPVGSVYEQKTSVSSTSPANLFGGTWVKDTNTYQFEGITRYWRTA